jgi:hypothetical protein
MSTPINYSLFPPAVYFGEIEKGETTSQKIVINSNVETLEVNIAFLKPTGVLTATYDANKRSITLVVTTNKLMPGGYSNTIAVTINNRLIYLPVKFDVKPDASQPTAPPVVSRQPVVMPTITPPATPSIQSPVPSRPSSHQRFDEDEEEEDGNRFVDFFLKLVSIGAMTFIVLVAFFYGLKSINSTVDDQVSVNTSITSQPSGMLHFQIYNNSSFKLSVVVRTEVMLSSGQSCFVTSSHQGGLRIEPQQLKDVTINTICDTVSQTTAQATDVVSCEYDIFWFESEYLKTDSLNYIGTRSCDF